MSNFGFDSLNKINYHTFKMGDGMIKNYNNKNSASANEDSTGYYKDNARPDSITAKANMVRQFDLKNSKKK